ncbi:hypothetical protein SKAU_G00365870 [Synaphobranchus kaupii]|uniref:Uncharacterized protein n=1 Tax=Synaphobranchus kaupii TaxID=118154 RepID=A0A9Q1IFH5_SYNKA|nr:hypothetical protein SKAU_G00365870 [Synaphobranchus kaupii]
MFGGSRRHAERVKSASAPAGRVSAEAVGSAVSAAVKPKRRSALGFPPSLDGSRGGVIAEAGFLGRLTFDPLDTCKRWDETLVTAVITAVLTIRKLHPPPSLTTLLTSQIHSVALKRIMVNTGGVFALSVEWHACGRRFMGRGLRTVFWVRRLAVEVEVSGGNWSHCGGGKRPGNVRSLPWRPAALRVDHVAEKGSERERANRIHDRPLPPSQKIASAHRHSHSQIAHSLTSPDPHESTVPSINNLIPSSSFFVQYATIDHAISVIKLAGRGSWLNRG